MAAYSFSILGYSFPLRLSRPPASLPKFIKTTWEELSKIEALSTPEETKTEVEKAVEKAVELLIVTVVW